MSDRRPGDDAALLAVMGLIRLFKTGRRHALLQSVAVLEHTLLHSKYNYDALLILVRIYMFLGAGSLAVDRYNRLSIKNIQHATISWALFTRLSTIYPYVPTQPRTAKVQTMHVPMEGMVQGYQWFEAFEGLSWKAVHAMQECNQWSLSLDSFETTCALANSFAKCLFYTERQRLDRLFGSWTPRTPQGQSQ